MDDAAILREIARRIREGIDAAATPTVAPFPTDVLDASGLARLAHELKTPLGAIVAAADLMAQERLGPLADQYRGYAEDIAASGRHALTLIDRLADADARAGSEPPLDFTELDLNRLAERAAALLRPQARDRGQTIDVRLAPNLPRVIADSTSVRQILLNLLANAVKYASAGTRLEVATDYVLDGPVTLSVRDEGPGIPDAVVAAVRAGGDHMEPAAKHHVYGLHLVHRLAAANGATVAITTAPNAPTSVTITFARDRVVPV